LTFYRALASGLPNWLSPEGAVAVEIGSDQEDAVAEVFTRAGCMDIIVSKDYNDLPRVVTARYQGAAEDRGAGQEEV
jgi:methylase of polypeptide subunit release factors